MKHVRNLRNFIAILVLPLFLIACGDGPASADSTATAKSTKKKAPTYPEVKVGSQIWMAKNLNVQTFANGERIPQATTRQEFEEYGNNRQPAWCYPNFDSNYADRYGVFYNWFAVSDPRGLAPKGWRIPTDDDWDILANNAGGVFDAGTNLKSDKGWFSNANGTNSTGFNAIPTGGMSALNGYSGETRVAVFWSATQSEVGPSFANYRVMHAPRTGIYKEEDVKISGFSVRCIKDF